MQGQTINGYTLKSRLGEGGMAEVWYAENEIGKPAAVKILNENLSRNTQIVERFHNEALVMVKLDHPNIRQVYGYGYIGNRHCIIMEYLDGDDLEALLKSGRLFTDEEVRRWWNQTVDALNYTHAMDIVHRDIKPSNLFLDKKGNIKLLDFGIAKVKESMSMTRTGMTMGTLMYMSPEQVKDPKRVGVKSDVYSLAVSFVHLLSGKPIYDNETSSEYDIQVSIVTQPVDLSSLPAAWQGFLAPYLEKDPDKRPALRHFEETAHTSPIVTPTVVQPETTPSTEPSRVATPSSEVPHSRPAPLSSEPQDKPKSKAGLWIGIGAAAVAVAMAIVFLLPKVFTDNSGSTSMVVSVSGKDVITVLAGPNSNDPTLQLAMEMATKKQEKGNCDFVTLLGESFEEVDPNARLASIFLYEFRDKDINVNSSNQEVLQVLKNEYDGVMNRCNQILEKRIRLFCEKESGLRNTKLNINRLKDGDRIRIEFTNKKLNRDQIAHVTKLLQTQGSLGFYETYNFNEINRCFDEINGKMASNAAQTIDLDTTFCSNEYKLKNSLYSLLVPSYYQNSDYQVVASETAIVGLAKVKDTADINHILAESGNFFPRNLKLVWMAKSETLKGENGEDFEVLSLVALKVLNDGRPALSGNMIAKATQELNSSTKESEVSIEMNQEGKELWKRLTKGNIGRQIAIVFDGYVYSCPVVNCEIPNGRSSISGGNMTVDEATDLANLLNAGASPVPVYVKEVTAQ